MHCSIWKFAGDPEDLAGRYDALMASVPAERMVMHAAVKMPDGLWLFDTCPSEAVFRDFADGPFRQMLAAHGLPEPVVEDHPLHSAYVNGVDLA